MGIFGIRISPAMGGATILSDGYSIGRRIFGLDRERPTAFEAAILALGILLTAAAIAACVTIVISCMHAGYFPHDTKLNAELRSTLAPDFEGEHAAVAAMAPAVALESPFASRGGLLFLSEPVGSEPLPEGQAYGFSSAERLPAGLVVGTLFPAILQLRCSGYVRSLIMICSQGKARLILRTLLPLQKPRSPLLRSLHPHHSLFWRSSFIFGKPEMT